MNAKQKERKKLKKKRQLHRRIMRALKKHTLESALVGTSAEQDCTGLPTCPPGCDCICTPCV